MSVKFIFGISCLSAFGAFLFALGIATAAVTEIMAYAGAPLTGIGAGILVMAYLLVRRHPPAASDEGENKAPQSPTGIQNVAAYIYPRPPGAQQVPQPPGAQQVPQPPPER